MRSYLQSKGLSILDHGLSVRRWYLDLLGHVVSGSPLLLRWRMPEWIGSPVLRRLLTQADDSLIGLYQVYHDCGKPLCREVDAEGRQHFPDHAAVSARRWRECSDGPPGSEEIACLIGMDMDVHSLRPGGVAEFASRPQAGVLLATGLSELHSNAEMFGGTCSPGFRSKHKRISILGGRVLEAIG